MTIRQIAIVADDLTGATDSVLQFHEAGWDAYLLMGLPLDVGADSDRATSCSTDSRALSTHKAAERTQQAVCSALGSGAQQIYLKIDSTMRGSVAGQISGALSAWRRAHPAAKAVVCSAYPAMGRTIQNGRLLVNGADVTDSPAGRDPVTPVTTSALTALIPGAVSLLPGSDPEKLAWAIRAAGAEVVVVDATSDEDLQVLAEAVSALGMDAIPVGSAGLAAPLAQLWRGRARSRSSKIAPPGAGVTVLVSSLHDVALRQLAHAQTVFGSRMQILTQDGAIQKNTDSADITVVRSIGDREENPREMADRLARQVVATLESGQALILVGGDGAQATLDLLGAQALHLVARAAEGVPLSQIVGGAHDGTWVITKSGGFGAETTLSELLTILTTGGKV
ncbi:MAG: four-carbon acid sugar kinase family protein [Candidatus Competibacteraceae bacterium]|nr:four-carbon acid sugar kinase family protein [Candidatus Competibacteraceae bacterium]